MISFLVGFALLLHVCFWGAGLATLIMPRPWQRFWPVLVPLAGFSLQSAVVWLGAYAGMNGTNHYAWGAGILPGGLLGWAVVRRGLRAWWGDVSRFGLVWAEMAGVLVLLLLPLSFAAHGLTTVSLGSCDAADYAAGARTFMEFSRADRTGFMGLTEVVRVASTENFYDFWLRLNHFSPSALIALNGSVLDCPPHQLTGLFTAVVLASSVPLVFWISRALFGYAGIASLVIAALYGVSPIAWYSYAHISPAPLLAAQAVAVLTWAGIALWNGRLTLRRSVRFAAPLILAYGLLLGAYNFFIVVALVPALAFAGGSTLARGRWRRLAGWVAVMTAPFLLASLVYWDRVEGIVERFQLFQTYDFGWKVPAFGPEGWVGLVQGGTLQPWWWPLRWLLAVAFVSLLSWATWRSVAARRWRGWLVIAATVPVLIGYAYLELRGNVQGTNASYDAFKLFAVFYPVMLPAFCWWDNLRWAPRLINWTIVLGFAALVAGLNLVACAMNIYHLSHAPLIVDRDLRQIRVVEAMDDVTGVNVLLPDVWSRLWANVFLLQKAHYFPEQTYEGRLRSPLRGDWDLSAGPVRVDSAQGALRPLSADRWLIDTRSPRFIRARPAAGWHATEGARDGERWTWTEREASIEVTNPTGRELRVRVQLDGRAFGGQPVAIFREGHPTPAIPVGAVRATQRFPDLTLPPGESRILVRCHGGTRPPGEGRLLGVCVYALTLSPE